jgi:uncharacterized protein YdhG (YjbR/CyaY superfamily)
MPKTTIQSIDEYLALQPKPMRAALSLVRETIRKALPKAEEGISYQMPAFKLHGSTVLYFAGWKEHYALYPGSGSFIASLKKELASFNSFHICKTHERLCWLCSMPRSFF